MTSDIPIIHLKIERRSTHPWIFQKMVEKPAVRPKPGSVVDIIDREGNWVGRGFYNGHSRIALRVLTAIRTKRSTRRSSHARSPRRSRCAATC